MANLGNAAAAKALDALFRHDKVATRQQAVTVLTRLLGNIVDHPSQPRFRQLNRHKFRNRFGEVAGVAELLRAVGFVHAGKLLRLPASVSALALKPVLSKLRSFDAEQRLLGLPVVQKPLAPLPAAEEEATTTFAQVIAVPQTPPRQPQQRRPQEDDGAIKAMFKTLFGSSPSPAPAPASNDGGVHPMLGDEVLAVANNVDLRAARVLALDGPEHVGSLPMDLDADSSSSSSAAAASDSDGAGEDDLHFSSSDYDLSEYSPKRPSANGGGDRAKGGTKATEKKGKRKKKKKKGSRRSRKVKIANGVGKPKFHTALAGAYNGVALTSHVTDAPPVAQQWSRGLPIAKPATVADSLKSFAHSASSRGSDGGDGPSFQSERMTDDRARLIDDQQQLHWGGSDSPGVTGTLWACFGSVMQSVSQCRRDT